MLNNLTPDGILIKPLDGFPGYGVTVDGRVWSCRKNGSVGPMWGEMKASAHPRGYLMLAPCVNGKHHHKTVHTLVAQAFLPREDGRTQVNHIDGNKQNNHIFNLEWVTPEENHEHARRAHLHFRGEKVFGCKITEDIAREIRLRYAPKIVTMQMLADEYGLGLTTVWFIIHKKSWAHVD